MPEDIARNGETRPSRLELARRRRELLREPGRLVTRSEAALLLGVSLDTVDRRLRRQTGEGRTAWGAIGLPAASLAEHFHDPWPGRGRPEQLEAEIVFRIVSQRRAGWTFAAIAAALNEGGVATAHGGARWWPATVRKVVASAERTLLTSSPGASDASLGVSSLPGYVSNRTPWGTRGRHERVKTH